MTRCKFESSLWRNFLLSLLAVAAILPTLRTAKAQGAPRRAAYSWHSVVVGGGGYAPDIIFSRAQRGLAYLRTDMGGAYRWDSRKATWMPLQDGEEESSYMGIESIAADPVDPGKVYMAVGMYRREPAAILRSDDAGAHWQASPLPISMGGNEGGRGLGERLAIAPWNRQLLFFGSRHDGLWRSVDGAKNWRRVDAFPYRGKGIPEGWKSDGGIAFVVCDARAGMHRIYAGVADPGAQGIYRSDDGGAHWSRIEGGPPDLLPLQAGVDAAGTLYVTYGDGIGPNGIVRGAVWALEPEGSWRNVTPDAGDGNAAPGFMGLAVDPSGKGFVLAATIDHWNPGDTVWRSHDGGRTWQDLSPKSRRDVSMTPFLKFGANAADFGHWISGLAIDPFDPGTFAYTTGATLYRTRDGRSATAMTWRPWTQGIEQTAVLTLVSPSGGAPLISGFGDLGGFVHWRLDRSPAKAFDNPRHTDTHVIDYAGGAPSVVVRSGVDHEKQRKTPGLALSLDGGLTWRPLATPDAEGSEPAERHGRASIAVSADGSRIYVGAEHSWVSADQGRTWKRIDDVARGLRIVTDKHDPAAAYAIDQQAGQFMVSHDAGAHFAPAAASGMCPDLGRTVHHGWAPPNALAASPMHAHEVYVLCGSALYRSTDAGHRFARVATPGAVSLFGLGKGRAAQDTGIFVAVGTGTGTSLWRSLDSGAAWQRIDDAKHRWGNRLRYLTGDPRRVGRVYIATDGRGIFYGDPS